jgi:hypothetical protein
VLLLTSPRVLSVCFINERSVSYAAWSNFNELCDIAFFSVSVNVYGEFIRTKFIHVYSGEQLRLSQTSLSLDIFCTFLSEHVPPFLIFA